MAQDLWVLFRCFGDGDCYPQFDLLGIFTSADAAKQHAVDITAHFKSYFALHNGEMCDGPKFEPVHPAMTADNGWSYMGCRKDLEREWVPFGEFAFAGFVIERHVLNKVHYPSQLDWAPAL